MSNVLDCFDTFYPPQGLEAPTHLCNLSAKKIFFFRQKLLKSFLIPTQKKNLTAKNGQSVLCTTCCLCPCYVTLTIGLLSTYVPIIKVFLPLRCTRARHNKYRTDFNQNSICDKNFESATPPTEDSAYCQERPVARKSNPYSARRSDAASCAFARPITTQHSRARPVPRFVAATYLPE